MYPASTHPTIGTWIRQNRKNTTEKSIIYYILVSSTQKRIIENIEIDELGTIRIKGKNDTDHNTITATILTECSNPHSITKKIKINNKEGWDKFNNKIKEMIQNKEIQVNCDTEYEQIIETIKRTMKESLGETKRK